MTDPPGNLNPDPGDEFVDFELPVFLEPQHREGVHDDAMVRDAFAESISSEDSKPDDAPDEKPVRRSRIQSTFQELNGPERLLAGFIAMVAMAVICGLGLILAAWLFTPTILFMTWGTLTVFVIGFVGGALLVLPRVLRTLAHDDDD